MQGIRYTLKRKGFTVTELNWGVEIFFYGNCYPVSWGSSILAPKKKGKAQRRICGHRLLRNVQGAHTIWGVWGWGWRGGGFVGDGFRGGRGFLKGGGVFGGGGFLGGWLFEKRRSGLLFGGKRM